MGDTLDLLQQDLKNHFPTADIHLDQNALKDKIDLLCRYVEKPSHNLDLPLDLHGSSFELSVWQEIKLIQRGKTCSYKEIAKRIHRPNASRAVARACAHNIVALAIPCHRVVGHDESLCGYRWGIFRKRALLEREKQNYN